jgi:Ca2+-binding RTX toxin-like protein
MRIIGARVGTGMAVLAAGSVFASAAQAATVEVVDGTVVFTAAPGETNDVRIGNVRFTDVGAPLTAGPGCEQIDANSAQCPQSNELQFPAVVSTGDGDDRVSVFQYCCGSTVTLRGGSGDDNIVFSGNGIPAGELVGGPGNDVLRSNEQLGGFDVLRGGRGDDVLRIEFDTNLGGGAYGGAGDDELYYQGNGGGHALFHPLVLDGGNGDDTYRFRDQFIADAMVPGPGLDTLDESTAAVTRVLDGLTFDMSACPLCAERVIGTPRADVITGDDHPQAIQGGDGNDVIDGGGGRDRIEGQAGDDTITARDSVFDAVGCDGGLDTVVADRFDLVSRDCETVSRGAVPGA